MYKLTFNALKNKIKRILVLVSNIIIFMISLIIPKTEKIIVVGGWFGKRFADNSKHLFLYASREKVKLDLDKVVWITRKKIIRKELEEQGYTAYMAWSVQSIWYHFRAKTHFIDQSIYDINPYFSVRSKRINLWHGFPLKKVGTFAEDLENKKIDASQIVNKLKKASTEGFWEYQFVLATSKFSSEILRKAFDKSNKSMIISGYPRNYASFVQRPIKYISNVEIKYLDLIEVAKQQKEKIVGYFPTFRDNKETLIFGTQDYSELKETLNYFKGLGIKIVSKFHFAGNEDNLDEIINHESFVNLPPDVDVYSFLSEVDILITDYSSIYFDFLLWKRPMIFFPYDLNYYRDEDRGLIFNYEEFTPGPKVYNITELKQLLSEGVDSFGQSYNSDYSKKAEDLKTKIFEKPEDMGIEHLIKKIRLLN